jgi:Zn-dependent protease with chaperone function
VLLVSCLYGQADFPVRPHQHRHRPDAEHRRQPAGVSQGYTPGGLDLSALAMFCFIYGMGGAFISLLISRWVAKRATGVNLVDGRSGDAEADWLYATVRRLTQQANLPMPEVGIYESPRSTPLRPARARAAVSWLSRAGCCAGCATRRSKASSATRWRTSPTAIW